MAGCGAGLRYTFVKVRPPSSFANATFNEPPGVSGMETSIVSVSLCVSYSKLPRPFGTSAISYTYSPGALNAISPKWKAPCASLDTVLWSGMGAVTPAGAFTFVNEKEKSPSLRFGAPSPVTTFFPCRFAAPSRMPGAKRAYTAAPIVCPSFDEAVPGFKSDLSLSR